METSRFMIALEAAADVFMKGIDKLQALEGKVSVARAKAINFAIDEAKAEGVIDEEIVKGVDRVVLAPAHLSGGISKATRDNYRSGVGKALAHGVAWHARTHDELKAIQEPGKKVRGRKANPKADTKAVTLGTVKVDRKARTLEVKLGKSTDLEAFTAAVTAIQSEPARVALFLAYVKAQGWTK